MKVKAGERYTYIDGNEVVVVSMESYTTYVEFITGEKGWPKINTSNEAIKEHVSVGTGRYYAVSEDQLTPIKQHSENYQIY